MRCYYGLVAGLTLCISMVFITSLPAQKAEKVSVEGLIYDLERPEAERRKQAVMALGVNRIHQAVPALIKLISDPDDSVRLEVARALVRINDTRALQAYVHLTRDPKEAIQGKAIEGIINVYVVEESGFVHGVRKFVGFVNPFSDDYNPLMVEPYVPVSQDAVNALADLLSSPATGLRQKAATGLGILRARSVLPAIEDALSREVDTGVKVELIRSIYKIGDPSAGRAVVDFIRDPERKVRDEAIFTAGRLLVKEAVPVMKGLYESGIEDRKKILGIVPMRSSDDLLKRLLEALAYIGDPSCKDIFLAALEDPRDDFRRYGAEGLGRVGDRSVTTRVATHYLREESDSAKLAMSFSLFRLGREEHLVELVLGMDKGDQARYYLLELKPGEVPKLYPYIESEKDSTKAQLLEVVGLRGDRSALTFIEPMRQSENPDVVSAANLADRRIQGRHPITPPGN